MSNGEHVHCRELYSVWGGVVIVVVCCLINVPATCKVCLTLRDGKDTFTCCYTEIETADQTFYLTQSQCTDAGLSSPSADPLINVVNQWLCKFCNNNNNNHIQRRYSRFFTISSQGRELSPTHMLKWPRRNRVQITCNTSSAYHVQVSCYVAVGTKGQLSC